MSKSLLLALNTRARWRNNSLQMLRASEKDQVRSAGFSVTSKQWPLARRAATRSFGIRYEIGDELIEVSREKLPARSAKRMAQAAWRHDAAVGRRVEAFDECPGVFHDAPSNHAWRAA